VSVISDRTNQAIANITVGKSPYGVAYDSGKGEVFMANHGSNSVSVISDSSNSVVATVNVGNDPFGLAYDSAKGEVFVANEGYPIVSVISLSRAQRGCHRGDGRHHSKEMEELCHPSISYCPRVAKSNAEDNRAGGSQPQAYCISYVMRYQCTYILQ
jgi:YVTN family beta-propeller protein